MYSQEVNLKEEGEIQVKQLPDLGNHLILEFFDVQKDLNDMQFLDKAIREILGQTSVTIEGVLNKQFQPQGITIVYLLSESHFSIHTWPELKACAIDFYHCGDKSIKNLQIAEEKLNDLFGWEKCTSTVLLKRGQVSSYLTNDFLDKSEILRNVRLLHREKSQFQEIRVYDTLNMGRILVLDGAVQFSTQNFDQDHYTWDMTHSVLKKEKKYDKVIIIGGGDLIIAAYILKNYPDVKKLVVADIDKRVVDVTRKYFSFADVIEKEIQQGRLEIYNEGGAGFMQKLIENGEKESVGGIIIDCTDFALDENSIAAELFTSQFYSNIHSLLQSGGYFSQQITKIFYKDAFWDRAQKGGFKHLDIVSCQTPEYGGELPLAVCFKE